MTEPGDHVMRDEIQQGLFGESSPATKPEAHPEDRTELLAQLRTRRRELVDHFAIEAGGDDAGLARISGIWLE